MKTANDSCDQSGCQNPSLLVVAKDTFAVDIPDRTIDLSTYTLSFCGHHGNQNIVELRRRNWIIIDDFRTFRIEDPRGANGPGAVGAQRTG